jgi:di/tricarboxylate transporter
VFVSVLAETVTYSAAAAIGLPFAVETANALGLSYRPFAMAALIASACCLATPIGNPVNTMIWAPGGYQFKDFLKLGLPMNLIYTLAATFIGPIFFPFNPTT